MFCGFFRRVYVTAMVGATDIKLKFRIVNAPVFLRQFLALQTAVC